MPIRWRIVALMSRMWTGILHDVVAEVVGLAERDARLDAGAGEPVDEAARMVVAAVVRSA
jgi:hypothetical protein